MVSPIPQILEQQKNEALKEAEFSERNIECYCIDANPDKDPECKVLTLNDIGTSTSLPSSDLEELFDRLPSMSVSDAGKRTEYSFRCLVQRELPRRKNGRSGVLPFGNADDMKRVFKDFELPLSYFEICDGSLTIALPATKRNSSGEVTALEFSAYYIGKQGDWATALSYNPEYKRTSAYLIADDAVQPDEIIKDIHAFRHYVRHPMLFPCIMFSKILKAALKRRAEVWKTLLKLEESIKYINNGGLANVNSAISTNDRNRGQPTLESCFGLLEQCKTRQQSRMGRYQFWQSYEAVLCAGFEYSQEKALGEILDCALHKDLKEWATRTWQKLQSLEARDNDHITRVNNASSTLYQLVQQRDSRNMKFIALLGSVFLPAGLVASILNVEEFQFVSGGELFGAYAAITVALIAGVAFVYIYRTQWKAAWVGLVRKMPPQGPDQDHNSSKLDSAETC